MVARARVLTSWQRGVEPDGEEIPIVVGDVAQDATANVRATLDLTTTPAYWPERPTDLVAPYGNEIFVERGIRFGNGTTEWISQGYFKIYAVDQEVAVTGDVQIDARDRMAGIVDARMEKPRQFGAAHTVEQVVESLVLEVYPDAQIVTDGATNLAAVALGRSIIVEEDRYAALLDVVRSIGRVAYWNHEGDLFIGLAPNAATPVFDVDAGPGGVLVSASRSHDREGVYNAVVAYGEATDTAPPVRAIARDLNPTSPTYWYGKFGKVPRFYSSPLITTAGQAQSAAASMLRQSLGLPYAVDFDAVPNPALEPLDPIRLVFGDGRAERHVIQKITLGLTAEGGMSAETQDQTSAEVSVE